jgi:hypothetical protein
LGQQSAQIDGSFLSLSDEGYQFTRYTLRHTIGRLAKQGGT